ncbi:MAG TPA: methyltransferase domain-containing protein [Candidatus Omnitrophota bacterium]|jgi:ubiquinone/menaquinone biosynthesis C-methylase UbiE|nr:methyltransferase domain-containing protein [Candidatus Omnitrophota bacterium]HPW77139.1 methyltransferase domain-containing protein [Candidatus Omnitrophota bacterium]HQB12294.1 methyltransferase domain-containing protein [Candidatus Omnitrophota bacterium]
MELSVVLIVKNEEKHLEECLSALRFADEIVIVDSGSTDRTVDIAKGFTDKVFSNAFSDFSSQKNFAVSQAAGKWILVVDADERVSPELAAEIRAVCSKGEGCVAYRIHRQTYFLDKRMRFSGMQDDRPIRLFKRGSGRFEQPIHEYYRCEGAVGDLKNDLIHHTTPTIDVEISKTELYTDLEARFLIAQGVRPSFWNSMKPLLVFVRLYFFRLGFLDGMPGLQYAYFSARYCFRKYRKFNELYQQAVLETKIKERFDDFAKTLPKKICRSDSRLNALLAACGSLKDKKVLEVGCGKGRFVEVMLENGAAVTGVDPSDVLLEDARKLKGGTFLQSSASQLPFEDGTFDIVYTVEVVGHLPLLERSIAEMSRVLKKNGCLVIVDRNKFSINHKRFLAPNFLIKRWHELKDHWIYPKGFPFRERWFSKSGLSRLLRRYFANVTASYIESDGEKRCPWHFLFDLIPMARVFVLWKGVKN